MSRAAGSWRNAAPLKPISREELEALPPGTVRAFKWVPATLSLEKMPSGRWLVHGRGRIDEELLVGLLSAPRIRRGSNRDADG